MSDKVLRATHTGELKIGNIVIPCAVLEDGTRVLWQQGFLRAIGRTGRAMSRAMTGESFQVPIFLRADNLRPFISKELIEASSPIVFRPLISSRGGLSFGFKAEILPQVCNVFLDAKDERKLRPNQEHIYERCKILIRGFAVVGITALVDEATGYQVNRPKDDLRRILELYISKELLPWTRRFPEEFYKEMFRLRGWDFDAVEYKRKGPQGPRFAGKLTRGLVYQRLPPGVCEELERINPYGKKGRKYHQHRFLTDDIGHVHLEKHVAVVTALMRVSPNWRTFERLFNRNFPKPQGSLFDDLDDIEDNE
jgi:hypothetical protein